MVCMDGEEEMKILIDCDGVLTDGRMTIDHTGKKQFKQFHTRDVRAIRELVYNGWEVYIVSADEWHGIYHFADKVGAEVYFSRHKEKLPFDRYVAIGDDSWDVGMLEKAKVAFCPKDAGDSVLAISGIQVIPCKGGYGVVATALPEILAIKDYEPKTNQNLRSPGCSPEDLQRDCQEVKVSGL